MGIYRIIREENAGTVLILGLSKNAGKTFSLNHLVKQGIVYGERLGLTSTGRDGESLDLITGKSKPRIFCPEGSIVATAKMAAGAGTAMLSKEERTGIDTVLGEISVYEVEREGYAELAGPLFAGELEEIFRRMSARGADRILVDGSLDRKAAGAVAGNVIVAVGAVLSRSIREIEEKAAAFTEQMTMSSPPSDIPLPGNEFAADEMKGAGALLDREGKWIPLPFSTLMGRGRELSELLDSQNGCSFLYVRGAMGEEAFRSLLNRNPPLNLIIRSPSSLFAEASDWRIFRKQGGVCYALTPLNLLAVTVNPYSPEGWEFPAGDFLKTISDILAPLPVFNPAI